MYADCIDKVFASPVFWTLMGLQAVVTGGFIVLAVLIDIKYWDAEDSPGTIFIAINSVFAIPVACFSFVFAGGALFIASTKIFGKNVGSSVPPLPGKDWVPAFPVP